MIPVAQRLQNVSEYYFSKKLAEIAQLNAAGAQVINLGIGSPDLPPHPSVIDTMQNTAMRADTHAYQSYRGADILREAFADWYRNRYQVSLDPSTDILPLMGSKEGIMHISMAFLNPGDAVLVPDPGYPTYAAVSKLLGAEVIPYDLLPENDFEPQLEALEQQDLSKVKIMWINYPHMPTGTPAHPDLFRKLIAFAQKHKILLVNDNPYSNILCDTPSSLLQYSTSECQVLELNSLSKSFNMAGWRVGALLGNKRLIAAVLQAKSNMDSGMFLPLQHGAAAALKLGEEWYSTLNERYAKRKLVAEEIMKTLGATVKSRVGMFVWAELPQGVSAEQKVDQLLYDKNVFITPGSIFGKNGANFLRISLCSSRKKLNEALARIKA